jgi:hypothetical protein
MKEVKREAERRQVELLVVPTPQAIEALEQGAEKTNAILHVTCGETLPSIGTLRLSPMACSVFRKAPRKAAALLQKQSLTPIPSGPSL